MQANVNTSGDVRFLSHVGHSVFFFFFFFFYSWLLGECLVENELGQPKTFLNRKTEEFLTG
ncbi:hypothetical protein HanXRQr2_Chr09g0371211 [Helianthus annuus]|uniref:Uncharacterized protein n=1 Tax=Helianthus annuus TaxID=4232 RepID=A0A9K3I402_HELAN|nr:hypothetical protein HanXRQr2_Chr09g0371211 [Helianthus annuus]KAJ0891738.1 hypothetical protein HanPSC8_Chr09g0357601 [Helianthus annuus]